MAPIGSMPQKAAGGYLDHTFSRMMWFKTTSVYLALVAGKWYSDGIREALIYL